MIKHCFLILLFILTTQLQAQIIYSLKWKAEIANTDAKTYKIILELIPDTAFYTVSMFDDTKALLPITIDLKEDKNLLLMGEWIENPRSILSHHDALHIDGKFIKERTTYTRAFKLKRGGIFVTKFQLSFWEISDNIALPPRDINFEIYRLKGLLKIRQLKKNSQ